MPLMTYQRGESDSPQRAFLAIPAGDGKLHVNCAASLMDALSSLHRAGIAVDVCFESGNCHVDDARNSLVRQFLQTDCTDLVFIDTDVGFPGDQLAKLLTYDRDVVAGVYPKKDDDTSFPVMTAPGETLVAENDGCVEVLGAPTGFMRIRRNVLERMTEQYQHRSFIGQANEPTPYTLLFEREIAEGRRWSGDYNFCRRWRKMGGKIHVDPRMHFTHEGFKQWSGCLGDYWRKIHGVTEQAFSLALKACKNGSAGFDDFEALVKGWDNPWAPSASFLATAYHLARNTDGPILDCGSGLTTLVLATTGREITALEHDPFWAMRVRESLSHHGLTANVQCGPLINGWYSPPNGTFPLVVIDGPPRGLGDRSRAYGYASGRVLVDDTQDPSQLEALQDWAQGDITQFNDGNKSYSVA